MRLAQRERYFLWAAVVFIAIFVFLQFLVFPFFENKRRIKRGVKAKEAGLREMAELRAEYDAFQKGSQVMDKTLATRKSGFTLFSFLEGAAGDAGVKTYIKSMKPSISPGPGPYKESLVEMTLEAITLQQVVDYLYRIESPENVVRIKRISIKENKRGSGSLDAILQVVTFQ